MTESPAGFATTCTPAKTEGAPTVLLIHGFLDDATVWDGLIGALAGEVATVRYDLPGFGTRSAAVADARGVSLDSLAGEAGDEIARDIELPADVHPGDLLAVACTGAYHHSMASNCNMVGRPPLVAVKDGRTRELIRRETIADLLSRDCG